MADWRARWRRLLRRLPQKILFRLMETPVTWTYAPPYCSRHGLQRYLVDYWEMKDAMPYVPARRVELCGRQRCRVFNFGGLCLVLIFE